MNYAFMKTAAVLKRLCYCLRGNNRGANSKKLPQLNVGMLE